MNPHFFNAKPEELRHPELAPELPFEDAPMGFQMFDKYPDTTLQIALTFDQNGETSA